MSAMVKGSVSGAIIDFFKNFNWQKAEKSESRA
jgi:hypothetical protein